MGVNQFLPIPKLWTDDIERLWEKVATGSTTDCWPWMAGTKDGYGRLRVGNHVYNVTRLIYFLINHVDPGSTLVCHTCDNRACCNPAHLWLGTYRDNARDRNFKGRAASRKGQSNGRSRLSEADICSIRQSPKLQCDLADHYGVAQTTISAIKRGETWRHI
jgi:hypothetical protein